MESLALYTATLMLMKQTIAWGLLPGCNCGLPPICPPPVICPPRICPPCLPVIPIKPISSCCQTCICSVRRKRDSSSGISTEREINPMIRTNATESTFAIKKTADSKLGAKFNVFCAMNDLAHVAYAENFCQHKKGNIICFAYKF
uniref:Ground-like domain-containing protein n=1 Tax=Elaeophora elaphi TaxID=1147741 RepID=A0A0R3RVR8_9BILA